MAAWAQDQFLRPFDRIRISTTGARHYSADATVGEDGSILIGNQTVYLGGRTLDESATEIRRVLGPIVGLVGIEVLDKLVGSATYRGAVERSGSVRVTPSTSIADVLFMAGPTDSADINGIIVVTSLGKTIRVDSVANPEFRLRPGDQILVPQLTVANEVLVLGAVKTPGSYPFKSGLTLEAAVALAGGLTAHAIENQIEVLRNNEPLPDYKWTAEGKGLVLKRGDLIRVASVENGRFVSVLGYIKNPGLIAFKPGMTLMEAVEAAGGAIVGAGLNAVEIRKVFSGKGRTKRFDLNTIRKGSPNDPKLEAADVVYIPVFTFPEAKPTGFRPVVPPRRAN